MAELVAVWMVIVFVVSFLNTDTGNCDHDRD